MMNDECIRQYGEKLDKSKYTIDIENRTFSTEEDDLILDFSVDYGWTFITGSRCVFDTLWNGAFTTGYGCTFNTTWDCVFMTGSDCVFKTAWNCIFKNGPGCVSVCRGTTGTYRYFLDKSNYVFTEDSLIEIVDKNSAILNMKHENKLVRNLCKDILKGK